MKARDRRKEMLASLRKTIRRQELDAAEEKMWHAAQIFRLQTENTQLRQLTGFTIKTTDLQPKRTADAALHVIAALRKEVIRLRAALEEIRYNGYSEKPRPMPDGDPHEIARRALGGK